MTEDAMEDEANDPNVFRILITNDNHVGFKEDDKVRKRDALATFEEIFQIARSMNVDFVLHSGDLFDDARPNRFWLNSVMRVFRNHCFGDREIGFQQIPTEFSKPANFEDANFNIDLPVYMIHGNHDDAGGEFGDSKALSCADVLETANLVNYFGKQDNVEEEIEVRPILLQKGESRVALYGLGNIRDERLHRMFQAKKVKFLAPPEEFFNLMSIHQNRYRGNAGGAPSKSTIHKTFLPSFLNLVVWAHEHECIPSPEESLEAGFHILQSGSSVATSLTAGEAADKNVFLLEVAAGGKFRVTPIPLLSVRPLIVDELTVGSSVEAMLTQKIDAMILQGAQIARQRIAARSAWLASHPDLPPSLFLPLLPELPLVRLKVHSPTQIVNQKFGRQFLSRVANPDDLLQFPPKRRYGGPPSSSKGVVQLELEDAPLSATSPEDVQDLIFNYLGGAAGEALLDVLVEPDFNVAVQDFVHKGDAQAIERFLKAQLDAIVASSVAAGVKDASGIQELSKKRAESLRNDRLSTALAAAENSQNRSQNTNTNGGPPKRQREESGDSDGESFSSAEIFQAAIPQKSGPPKRRERKSSTVPHATPAVVPSITNPILAAFLSQTEAPTRRQWARRM